MRSPKRLMIKGWAGIFFWFRQAHIVCWASPAPAAGTCFCCLLTFLWHCAECCLKRRECSQMTIIYPASLRSSVWMLLKNIKPESQNSEGCSLRIILNTLATKWSPWQQVHAQWKSAHPPVPCHPLNTCGATRENTMCSPPHHPHCSCKQPGSQKLSFREYGCKYFFWICSSGHLFLWEVRDQKHFVLEINTPIVAESASATQ